MKDDAVHGPDFRTFRGDCPGPCFPPAPPGKNGSSLPGRLRFAGGNGIFVVDGCSGTVGVSEDGINWDEYGTVAANWYSGVAYHDGLFVAVAGNGAIMTSSDGMN